MPETISQAISDIKRNLDLESLDEESVKQFVVIRLLSALEWNPFNPSEIKPEHRVGRERDRVTYALNPDSEGAVFIEVKRPSVSLENHQRQLLTYSSQHSVDLAVLTNGQTWWLYVPRYERPQGSERDLAWPEKRFAEINLGTMAANAAQKQFEDYLAKDKVASGEAVNAAKRVIDDRQVGNRVQKGMLEAWNQIIATPNEELVRLLTELTGEICGVLPQKPQVTKFMAQHRSRFRVSSAVSPPPAGGGNRGGRTVYWTFDSEERESRNWRFVLTEFCELIHERHSEDFEKILTLQGNAHRYFSRSEGDLRSPKQIGDTGYYAACNHTGGQTMRICKDVAELFGYPQDSFNARRG